MNAQQQPEPLPGATPWVWKDPTKLPRRTGPAPDPSSALDHELDLLSPSWDAFLETAGAMADANEATTETAFQAADRRRIAGIDRIARVIATPPAANENLPRPRFELTWFDDIAESEPKETIIEGAFGENEFSTVSGLPGSGKSVVMTDAGCHVAAGIEWHGRKVSQGLVVYIAAERKKLTERRMNAFRKHYGVRNVPLLVLGGRIDLTSSESDARALTAAIKQAAADCGQRCVWVIVDTLTRTFGPGDQNASRDMVAYVRSCDLIRVGTGAHVTAIHHTTWESNRGKGAIDLDGAVDESYIVKKTGKKSHVLECNGTNDGEEGVVLNFRMLSIEVGIDRNGKASTAPVVERIEDAGAKLAADLVAAHEPGRLAGKVLESLRTAIDSEGVEPDEQSKPFYPDGCRRVTEETWRAAYYATHPAAKRDTLLKQFRRGRRELLERGSVQNVGQWFWPDMPDGHGQGRTKPLLSADTE
jgi:hypothetical protein